jgi:hypothetical protein
MKFLASRWSRKIFEDKGRKYISPAFSLGI